MFRPIHGHHQVDCLKFPLCNKFHYVTELWRGDLNISLCYGVSIGSVAEERWMETKTICCFLVTPGVKCHQGSLGVVLLAYYAGPTVPLPHRLHTSHLDPPYRPLTPYIFAPQVVLNLPQPPQWDPHNKREERHQGYPDDTLPLAEPPASPKNSI